MIEGIKSSSDENYFDNFWKNRMIQDLSKIVIKNDNNDLGSVYKEPSESKPIYNLTFINNDKDMSEHEEKIDEHVSILRGNLENRYVDSVNEKVIYKKKKIVLDSFSKTFWK